MALNLSTEQKEKLRKLDEELTRKKEHEEKSRSHREASSKATGIPLDIVDLDVIKIGTLLGLIKKKSILEGKEPDTTGSILTMLLGNDDKSSRIDLSRIPRNFRNTTNIVSEADKITYHQQYVQKQCQHLAFITMELIKQELSNINRYIIFNLETSTIDNLKTSCLETLEVLLEELCDGEDDLELWLTLSVVRNALLGVVDVCEYKSILNQHIVLLSKAGKSYKSILQHLTISDLRLSLYSGCLTRTKGPILVGDANRLSREIVLRSYMKPPELKPFNFVDIVKHCCIPSLVCVPIDEVIENGLIGPYRNNAIGYLNQVSNSEIPWSFYNLKSITADGARLWILDNKLSVLTNHMISTMTSYLVKTFRTFYHEYYGCNVFQIGFWLEGKNNHYDAFLNMLRNLSFISNHSMFHRFLMSILIQRSPLIPTEYDFFNHVMYYDHDITYKPYVTCFEDNMKHVFDGLTKDQFDTIKSISL